MAKKIFVFSFVVLGLVSFLDSWYLIACDIYTGSVSGPASPTVGASVTYTWSYGGCSVIVYGNSLSPNANFTVTSMNTTSVTGYWNTTNTTTVSFWMDCNPGGIGRCSQTNLSVTPVSACGACPSGGSGSTWTWTGCQSTAWTNACNWDRQSVPTSTSNVIIPNTTNKPAITSGNAYCNTIEIQSSSGARIDISGTGVLNVTQ